MEAPILSVILPWSNRKEVYETLAANNAVFGKYNIEVIIANVGGDMELIQHLISDRVRVCYVPSPRFSRSLALNIGAYAARSANLFFLDTDIIVDEDFLMEAIDFIQNDGAVVVNKVMETACPKPITAQDKSIEEIMILLEVRAKNGRTARIQTHRDSLTYYSRVGNGLIFVTKKDFIAVNGMSTKMTGWGFEDTDLLIRLQIGQGLKTTAMGTVTHLSHDDSTRDIQGRTVEDHERINFTIALQQYQIGNFKGTYDFDIKRWEKELKIFDTPVPV